MQLHKEIVLSFLHVRLDYLLYYLRHAMCEIHEACVVPIPTPKYVDIKLLILVTQSLCAFIVNGKFAFMMVF